MHTTATRLCLAIVLLTGGAAAESATNWFSDLLSVGVSQTTVARHPIDRNRYYLCWTDGTSRHGLRFGKAALDRNLKAILPGQRVPLSRLLGTNSSTWTSEDERTCWSR